MKASALSAIISCAALWHFIIFRAAPRLRLVKPNFIKKQVMASYGIAAFVWIAAIACSLGMLGYIDWMHIRLYLAVMGSMWVLGALDDLFGSRKVGGFGGHFKKLIFERMLTTGAVKAIGGGVVGICAGWSISGGGMLQWLLAAALIPLAANTLNLLDLRPGRAVAVFIAGLVVTCMGVFGHVAVPMLVGAVVAVTLAFAVLDCRGRAMMGDSGSNALGAALGLTMALSTSWIFQSAAVVIMAGIQVYSEKYSLSALIERNRVLRAIDQRLGVR